LLATSLVQFGSFHFYGFSTVCDRTFSELLPPLLKPFTSAHHSTPSSSLPLFGAHFKTYLFSLFFSNTVISACIVLNTLIVHSPPPVCSLLPLCTTTKSVWRHVVNTLEIYDYLLQHNRRRRSVYNVAGSTETARPEAPKFEASALKGRRAKFES